MRKTGSLAGGVGDAVFEGGMLSPPASSPLFLFLDRALSGWDLGGSFGDGVLSRASSPSSPFPLALGKGGFGGGEDADADAAAFCISRCTTSSAILGEGGDGGAVAFSSLTILFSTGS